MKYYIITLGCPKNTVDSEGMHSILSAQGHIPVAQIEEANVIIVNTCSFIAAARDETLAMLRELGQQKVSGQLLIAAGCMSESHADLVQAVRGVDATLSTRHWMHIGTLIQDLDVGNQDTGPDPTIHRREEIHCQEGTLQEALHPWEGSDLQEQGDRRKQKLIPVLDLQPVAFPSSPITSQPSALSEESYADWRTMQIRRTISGPSAYLKISDGCNLRCAFCTIPSFKGDMRSKAMRSILNEAQEIAAHGVREIVLVAQHLTDYGRDLGLHDGLATLLDELSALLPPSIWIRLMYAYPHGITTRLIETMARHPQICAYLDMPLQHAHPDTLRRMRRPPDTEHTKATITALRAAMPNIALRSTFIVGFPGETETEFRTLLAFLEEIQFDRVGAFRYSREPGTHAATLPDQVRPHTIERRWHQFMQLQQKISRARNHYWRGRILDVLVEGHGTTEDGKPLLVGRSFRDAPEVDGQVFVWGSAPVGSLVSAHITHTADYDLWGEQETPKTTV